MRRLRLVPSNKGYGLVLCGALAAAVFFVGHSVTTLTPGDKASVKRLVRAWTTKEDTTLRTLRGRPILERDGKMLLWASAGVPDSEEAKWWDVTDALIDPTGFNHGIGMDRIPSIEEPMFVARDDARWLSRGLPKNTPVIGVEFNGEARAYPVALMSRHEIVNDTFGDAHLTVAY